MANDTNNASVNSVIIGLGNACLLFGTKQLPEPLVAYRKLEPRERIPLITFNSRNVLENIVCKIATILFKPRCFNPFREHAMCINVMAGDQWIKLHNYTMTTLLRLNCVTVALRTLWAFTLIYYSCSALYLTGVRYLRGPLLTSGLGGIPSLYQRGNK